MVHANTRRLAERPTLAVVARVAGVSTATASKVFNNRPDVAPATRRRVTNVLKDLGYEPTTTPRVLNRDPVVTVVFDSLLNSYSTQVLRGVLGAASQLGVDIVVEVLSEGFGSERPLSPSWIQAAVAKERRGVLVVTTEVTREHARALRNAGLPLVAIDPPNALDDSLISVGSTNFIGGMQATDHLIGLGHRRIAVAAGPIRSAVARERVHGYRSALEAAEIPNDDDLILHGEFDFAAGVEMSLVLLTRRPRPTAIIAGCDASALGVLEAARRLGVRVPQELSVVGFDDTPAALSSAPPLTTVRQPMTALGRVALTSVLQQAMGEQPASHHVQLATTLVVRESSAEPASAEATSER